MWELHEPKPVKLIVGILAADENALAEAVRAVSARFGVIDLASDIWPFTQTDYYKDQTGPNILRQFVTIENLIDPGALAKIKLATNKIEQKLTRQQKGGHSTFLKPLNKEGEKQNVPFFPRPVNLDPGLIEPSKLVLATTKNYSHRIYIGHKMYAEVTLMYDKGDWRHFDYTYPDYRQPHYLDFFTLVRTRLLEQLRNISE